MITKPTIIVTSLGRTGTKFFSTLFSELVPGGTSLHEPDVLNISQYHGIKQRLVRVIEQIQESGMHNLLVRRVLGHWSIIELSDARFRDAVDYATAVRGLLAQRGDFISSRQGPVYVESSIGYYGLVDVLYGVFQEEHRAVYLVRDGRDWIRSWMSWSHGGGMYDKSRLRGLFAHTWPTALDVNQDPYSAEWRSMSRFGRLCWGWSNLNQYALSAVEENPNARAFRFEDIFESQNRCQHLAELVDFATDLPGVEPVASEALDGRLDRKIHGSSGEFPAWPEWTEQQRDQFVEMCGPLMRELGYELD